VSAATQTIQVGDLFRWESGTVFRVCFIKGDEILGQLLWQGCPEWAPYGVWHTPRSLANAVKLT
jgi:hypothetical protein